MGPGLLWHPDVMFARGERSGHRAFYHLEVQRFGNARFGFDVANGCFGYAIDDQRNGVCPILQRWIVVTAITFCMNLSNSVRVTALNANLCTLNRPATGILYNTAEPG